MVGEELNVLAVAILGGASLVGGIGSMGGVVLGVLLLAMLQNGLNLLGVSSYFFGVVIGLAILVSISMTGFADKHCAQPAREASRLMSDPAPEIGRDRGLAAELDRLTRQTAARRAPASAGCSSCWSHWWCSSPC